MPENINVELTEEEVKMIEKYKNLVTTDNKDVCFEDRRVSEPENTDFERQQNISNRQLDSEPEVFRAPQHAKQQVDSCQSIIGASTFENSSTSNKYDPRYRVLETLQKIQLNLDPALKHPNHQRLRVLSWRQQR
ncbi:Hypothetical_protein [Hexamita inflata]|uniref:Hypothetical_protein n=1 Tax=Hexamita inflata TaxID=28002 RepID=A0AA86U0S6_9EUKA|nr:Hypothetical protein HINF_LOCUS21782 [Hexamita inflata]